MPDFGLIIWLLLAKLFQPVAEVGEAVVSGLAEGIGEGIATGAQSLYYFAWSATLVMLVVPFGIAIVSLWRSRRRAPA